MQTIEGKAKIDYPTQWEYRIIGRNQEKLKELVHSIITQDFELKDGQSSSGGKFVSIIVSTEVKSQEQRDQIFKSLKENPEVEMVL